MAPTETEVAQLAQTRDRLREKHLRPAAERPATVGRGIHHTALLSSDVERTITFYQDILGFPLTELIENRDYPGSSHFFFDVGNGNAVAFFDLPGLGLGPYAEVLGGLHHLALSLTPEAWADARARLDAAGVRYQEESGTSIYFADPDGARIELIADDLGEMYGSKIG
ncbi:VOC family protein [Amycolatopsis sp. GA6-003]|uniref:VOC family protein n=1 Tax=Amycolatopsis sp. GA6-003 TaxID=2652444 RepID=UPI0039170CA4